MLLSFSGKSEGDYYIQCKSKCVLGQLINKIPLQKKLEHFKSVPGYGSYFCDTHSMYVLKMPYIYF